MSAVTHVALLQLVREVLEKPLVREWSLQGFGMLRTYLGTDRRIRLHIWDSRFRVPNVSDIHDHPWDFESLVLSGSMRNIVYDVRPLEPQGSERGTAYEYEEGRIVCGPSPSCKQPQERRRVRLVAYPIEYGDYRFHPPSAGVSMQPGETYRMRADPSTATGL